MLKPQRLVPKTVATAALTARGLVVHATAPTVVGDIRIEGLQRVEPGTAFAYLPIRLSLGFPLTKHNGDQYQKFQFQLGTAF